MEFNREGYYTEHYDNDKEPYHNEDYNIESNIVFFGIFILCILAAFCSGGCGRWWDAELNESLIDDEVIIDIATTVQLSSPELSTTLQIPLILSDNRTILINCPDF